MATINQFDPPPKTTPHQSYYPVISNVQITAHGLVTWTTDIPSTSQVLYGGTVYLGAFTPQDPTLVTNHSVQLTGLTAGLWYLRVVSFRIDSQTVSDLYAFTFVSAHLMAEDGSYILDENGNKILLEIQ